MDEWTDGQPDGRTNEGAFNIDIRDPSNESNNQNAQASFYPNVSFLYLNGKETKKVLQDLVYMKLKSEHEQCVAG